MSCGHGSLMPSSSWQKWSPSQETQIPLLHSCLNTRCVQVYVKTFRVTYDDYFHHSCLPSHFSSLSLLSSLSSPFLSSSQALQKQLGARLSSKNAVTKAGKLLMKHKTGDDRVVLKKKLQDLEREWEEVCQVSVERQDRLEQAYKHIGQFRSHVIPLRSWMTKVLPMLDESEPVHGDIDTTDALMTAHSVSLSAHHCSK